MRLQADARMRPADGASRASRRRARVAAAVARLAAPVAAAGVLATSCAPLRAPTPPRPPAGYVARVDRLDFADRLLAASGVRLLAGRRIAIDPGHGGFFRGSLGVDGLTEAEVNLGVALELRELLEARGAIVFLTREDDRDFLTPADSALRSDLDERVLRANAFGPELFLSVHHNADAGGRHDVNETQTYWKLGDDGPSFELAQDVHRALVRNLGIGANRLLPGNYAVLRASAAPAILTESSYITYPPTEAKLRGARARRLEAEALLVGIERWFARAAPVFERVAATGEDSLGSGGPPVVRGEGPSLRATVCGPFDHAELRLDGVPLPLERRDAELAWSPREPLAPGEHELRLTARLTAGGSARAWTHRFRVAGEPARVVLEAPFQADGCSEDDEAVGLRARVLDALGRPVLEPARVRIGVPGACEGVVTPTDTTVDVRDGAAWAYARLDWTLTLRTPSRPRWTVCWPHFVATLLDTAGRIVAADTLAAPAAIAGTAAAVVHGFARDARTGEPVASAPGTTGASPMAASINRDGFGRFGVTPAGEIGPERIPGWRRVPDARASDRDRRGPPSPARYAPLFGGALHGRRIALDPAGNGDVPGTPGPDPAGVSASGTRAADVNLDVARALADLLRAAGAEVLLVRDSPAPVLDAERVRRSEAFRAERYLRIGHGPHAPRLGHYYASASGRRWAARTADALAALALPAVAPAEDAHWTLQQTSCPALHASLSRIDDAVAEAALLDGGATSREAYALLVGLAREWAPAGAAWPADSLRIESTEGRATGAAAVVTLGDAIVLRADRDGRVWFVRGEPGALAVTAEDRFGARTRAVLLDAQRGTVLHFSR